jgi:hypothetical protein
MRIATSTSAAVDPLLIRRTLPFGERSDARRLDSPLRSPLGAPLDLPLFAPRFALS